MYGLSLCSVESSLLRRVWNRWTDNQRGISELRAPGSVINKLQRWSFTLLVLDPALVSGCHTWYHGAKNSFLVPAFDFRDGSGTDVLYYGNLARLGHGMIFLG